MSGTLRLPRGPTRFTSRRCYTADTWTVAIAAAPRSFEGIANCMAATAASTSWYLLVFAALGLFATTFLTIATHMPRVPVQRGLLVVMGLGAVASIVTLLMTRVQEGTKGLYDFFTTILILAVAAGVLDLFYFVQARRRRAEGAGWSLVGGWLLLTFAVLGLIANFGLV